MRPQKNKCAAAVTVGEKGQIVIPKAFRDLFEIAPGDSLILLGDKKKGMAILPASDTSTLFTKMLGSEEEEEHE